MKSNIALLAIINKGFSIDSRKYLEGNTKNITPSKQTNIYKP